LRIAVAPGSGSAEKCWPARNFARTCGLLAANRQVQVMLMLGPAEMDRPEFRTAFEGVDCTVTECWSIPDLAAALAACDLYLGNDSGLSHLAAWSEADGLAVFGPTDPEIWAPLGRVAPVPMDGLSAEELADSAGRILDCAERR
jgi:ADP-heptose:LPS heptosyltransferase